MATLATLRERHAEISEILALGVRESETDESITKYDLAQLRKERAKIETQLPEYRRRRKGVALRITGLGN